VLNTIWETFYTQMIGEPSDNYVNYNVQEKLFPLKVRSKCTSLVQDVLTTNKVTL
jgi:hypothetical protein